MPSSASPSKHHHRLADLHLPPSTPSPATTSPPSPSPTPPPSPPPPPSISSPPHTPPPVTLPSNLVTDVCGNKLFRLCASSTPHIAHADFASIIVFQRIRPDLFLHAPLGRNAIVIPSNDFSHLPETAVAPGSPATPLPISNRDLFIRAAVQMNTLNALLSGAHSAQFGTVLHAVRLKFAVQMGELTSIAAVETDSDAEHDDDGRNDDKDSEQKLSATDGRSEPNEVDQHTLNQEHVEPAEPPPPVRPRAPPPPSTVVAPVLPEQSEQPTLITKFMGDVLFRLELTSKAWIRVSDFAAILEMQHRHPDFFVGAPTKGRLCPNMVLGRWAKLENPLGMALQINAFNAILTSEFGEEFEDVLEVTRMQVAWMCRRPLLGEPCCEDPECSGVPESAASSPTSSFYSEHSVY